MPTISGNQELLSELFQNLIANAIHYCDKAPKITIGLHKQGGRVDSLFIKDNGPSIPQPLQTKLFEPFTRYSGSEAGHYEHSGLGLAIARKIANLHGVELTLGRSDERGSCFLLWLAE